MTAPAATARNQQEIDALLRGETVPAVAPRPWALTRPEPWSRGLRARLTQVHDRFAAALEVQLAAALQDAVRVRVAGLESIRAGELTAMIGAPCAAFAVRVAGSEGRGFLDFGAELGLELAERLLGGQGGDPVERATLTPFEQALLRSLAERVLTLLGESWSAIEKTAFECGAYHADPALLGIPADESMLGAHLELELGGSRRDLAIALPAASLGARITEAPGPDDEEPAQARLESQLRRASADVVVSFPALRVRAGTLFGLQVGQVLDTRHAADGSFEVRVNDRLRFRGQMGQVRSRLGLRVTETVNAAEGGSADRPLEGRVL